MEASFQGNVETNFPAHRWNFGKESSEARLFDVCFLKQYQRSQEKQGNPGTKLLRFKFPETGSARDRIKSVEVISIFGMLSIRISI